MLVNHHDRRTLGRHDRLAQRAHLDHVAAVHGRQRLVGARARGRDEHPAGTDPGELGHAVPQPADGADVAVPTDLADGRRCPIHWYVTNQSAELRERVYREEMTSAEAVEELQNRALAEWDAQGLNE